MPGGAAATSAGISSRAATSMPPVSPGTRKIRLSPTCAGGALKDQRLASPLAWPCVPASTDVVIPVYGNYELTKSCLECLASQTIPHRVIVVDDGSRDDSVDRIKSDWPDVALVELGTNRGYTFAVNRGVQAGSGDYIVLLNNDVRLHPDCLEHLIAPFGEDERTGSSRRSCLIAGSSRSTASA